MSSKELPSMLGRLAIRQTRLRPAPIPRCCRRNASTESSSQEVISEGKVAQDIQELEGRSTFTLSSELDEHVSSYDPAKRAQGRRKQLPPSRYVGEQFILDHKLSCQSDINSVLHDTTEVLYTLTSLPQNQIQLLENTYLDHSLILDWSRHTKL